MDCGDQSKNGDGHSDFGRYTLTKTKYKESGLVKDTVKYLDGVSYYFATRQVLENFNITRFPKYQQALHAACPDETAILSVMRRSTSYDLEATESMSFFYTSLIWDKIPAFTLNGMYVTKEG